MSEIASGRFRAIFEHSHDAILLAGDEGAFIDVNPAAEDLLGYESDEFSNLRLWDLTPGLSEEEGRKAWSLFLAKGREEGLHRLQRKDGQIVRAECRAVARVQPGVHLSVLRDVTEQKRCENAILKAKKEARRAWKKARHARAKAEEMSRLKSAFLANMSHEIRTPLTTIIGFAELLADMVEGESKELLHMIQQSGCRLLETLTSVLELAEIESGSKALELETVEVREEVKSAALTLMRRAREKGLTLAVDVPDRPVEAQADRTALGRVLLNLVSNAVKFTDQGRVTIRLVPRSSAVEIQVEDTGIGIADEFVPHLFEEFTQESKGTARNYQGVGLGLSTTKRLVELMCGEITVESSKGKGTTFTVRLPRVSAVAAE